MIAEKLLPLKFDVPKLKEYYYANVASVPPHMEYDGNTFGGWSIQSASGRYDDGFQEGHQYFYKDENGAIKFNYELANKEVGFHRPKEHIVLTEFGTGYIAEVIQQIEDHKLKPHRARWTIVQPGGSTSYHRDAIEKLYAVRLHIPVITNPKCEFVTDEGGYHMPADGSGYLVAVNKMHKAVNLGDADRIHIIMDIWDDMNVSQFHTLTQHRAKRK